MDPNRGVVARVLVQNGTLRIGDTVVCGATWGRVRSISDDKGKQIEEAGPSSPVELIGLDAVPGAGDKFYVLDPARAREIAEERALTDREGEIAKRRKVTLENLYDTIQADTVKRAARHPPGADVQGSVDVLKTRSLARNSPGGQGSPAPTPPSAASAKATCFWRMPPTRSSSGSPSCPTKPPAK